MGPEVRADPVELARVAQLHLDTSLELAAALRALRGDAVLSTSDLGTVAQNDGLACCHDDVLGQAGTLYERLIAVLETDADDLLRVAFAYEQADQAAAWRTSRPVGEGMAH